MKWFYDLQIAQKLLISFILILILTTVLGLFSMTRLQKVDQASTDIANIWLPSATTTLEMKVILVRMRAVQLQHVLASKEEDLKKNEKNLDELVTLMRQKLSAYEKLINTDVERTIFPQLVKNFDAFLDVQKRMVDLSRGAKDEQARGLILNEGLPIYQQIFENADKLISINQDGAVAANKTAEDTYKSSRTLIFVMLGICITLGMTTAVWIARVVSTPLRQAVAVAKRVADGDLTADITSASKDETGQLMSSLKAMNDSLFKIVSQVRQGTDTIATASNEIAAGNLDLSNRTEQQASSLEETASSMEELTSTVKQNADNARQANQLAASASEVALQGGTVVDQVVSTMGSINDSSKKIVDIISVIDGIAFQTNILALNAAVEAARAGEQGRGFAVVASEVRTLAQRSASAAKEIKALIDDSVEKVDTGSKLVEQAGTTMHEVVSSVKRVTDIVGEISAASQEQSAGIGEVNQAITHMDTATQQNAALVEEAAAAAQSLQEQAERLAAVVSIFKLDSSQSLQASSNTPASSARKPAARPGKVSPVFKPAKTKTVTVPQAALQATPQATPQVTSQATSQAPRRIKQGSATDDSSWEQF